MKSIVAVLLAVHLAAGDPFDVRVVPLAGCDSVTLTNETGTVASPNHPNNYPLNQNCTWIISVPSDKIVRLSFTAFSTETYRDYVKVFDGPSLSSAELLRHSGYSVPDPNLLASSGNAMVVQFTSDGSISYSGFRADYVSAIPETNETTAAPPATLPPDFTCGGAGVGSGVIVSPNHPNLYDANLNCTWFIQSKSELVTVNFTTFMTEAKVDYVQVLDGWDAGAALLATLSGNLMADLPLAVTSPTGNKLTVRFVTDDSVEKEGFVAFYS